MDYIEQIKNKYLGGEANETELQQLLQWVNESPSNRSELFNEKDIWEASALLTNSKHYQIETELLRFNKTITGKKKILIPNWVRIAAMLILAIGTGWLIRDQLIIQFNNNELSELKEIVVPKGQMSQVFLADGTRIWVNADSKVTVPAVFSDHERSVTLEGEAFFEVAKDKSRPFHVKTENQLIEVLGTSFNVRAYPGSDFIQTTLKEGKIKLNTPNDEIILAPGEQSEMDRLTGKLNIKKVNTNFYDSWKEGRYEFENENLIEVFKLLERWYDIELIYDASQFKNMYFSGVIRKNKPFSHFLVLLDHSIPIDYKQDGDRIIIKKH